MLAMEDRADPGGAADEEAAPQHQEQGTESGQPEPLQDDSARIRELEERAERLLANWQRAQADFSNFRRQVEREQEELVKRASSLLMADVLTVVDDLERAMGSVAGSLRGLTWIDGVWLIYRKMEAILHTHGLEEITVEPGEGLDPLRHQAVAEVDGEPGKVVEVVQKGYTLHQQMLRPTMVTVGRHANDPESPQEATTAQPDAGAGEADSAS